jgi:hypothetical protein
VHPCLPCETMLECKVLQATASSGATHPLLMSVQMDRKQGQASAEEYIHKLTQAATLEALRRLLQAVDTACVANH